MRLGFLVLLLTAAPAAAQSSRAMGAIMCACPGRSKPLGSAATCEVACFGASGGGGGGGGGGGVDYGAIQRAQAEQAAREARQREAQAAAARRAREAMEQQKFERNKREALIQLKDVTVAEPQLKGVGGTDDYGLKGAGGGGTELKGLDTPKEKTRKAAAGAPEADGKVCRVTDPCRASMADQASAIESARAEQSDLYMAAASGDVSHGMDLAQGAIKDSGAMGRVSVYVWKTQDRFGVPQFADDYKAAVDEAAELVDEETLDAGTKGMGSKAVKLKKTLESMNAFNKYMKTLLSCAKGRDEDFDSCANGAAKNFSKTLDGLPIAEASIARVKAASDAFSKYTTNALKRGMRATDAASRCLAACP